MKTNKVLLLIAGLLCLRSCHCDKGMDPVLQSIAERMSAEPEAALSELRGIAPENFRSEADRASYSLLLSQALDKNMIDVRADSIIAPAVRYYEKHGTPDQKLNTCYYRARIAQNMGDNNAAMEWLVKGEYLIPDSEDYVTAGRVYSTKSSIYSNLFDFDSALANDLKASDMFLKAGALQNYLHSRIAIADDHIQLTDNDSAMEVLDSLACNWSQMNDYLRSAYLTNRIHLALQSEDYEAVSAYKDSCYSEISDAGVIPWMSLSKAWLAIDEPDSALVALQQYAAHNPQNIEEQEYHLGLARIYESLEDYKNALETYKEFLSSNGLYNTRLLRSDTRFVEERYEAQNKEMKDRLTRMRLIMLLLIIMVISLALIIIINTALQAVKSKLAQAEKQYHDIQNERDTLRALQERSTLMDSNAMALVNQRLSLLDKVILGHLSSDPAVTKEADKGIKDLLKDKDDFILNTSQIFAASHPKFTGFLQQAELTEWEVGYCCLFVMGMYSKDLEPYFSRATSSNLNNNIRRKLDLPLNGQKLRNYLAEKFEELEG